MVLSGVVGVLAGIVTFVQPLATAVALVYVIAAWAVVAGGLQILAAIRLRGVISDEWLMGLSGALSVLFGVLLLAGPAAGALPADPVVASVKSERLGRVRLDTTPPTSTGGLEQLPAGAWSGVEPGGMITVPNANA
jgi:hypothetical protein